jgi:high-affinity iron transporter
MIDLTAAIPTFVITLREGVEAALVVGIVLAYLKKADQSHLYSSVYAGIAAGIGSSILIGLLFLGLIQGLASANQTYTPVIKQFLEGGLGVIAIALLSWMLIWMTRQAKFLKAQLEGTMIEVLQHADQANWAVFSLIAIAVLREGFETVIFIAAQFQQGWSPVLGAVAGLGSAVVIGVMLFQLGIRINLRRFFQVMGVLLLLVVGGLVIQALRHFDRGVQLLAQTSPQLSPLCPIEHRSCILGPLLWDTSQILPDRQFPGVLLKTFFGYTQTLYLAQAIDYLLFLGIVGGIYLQSVTGWRLPQFLAKAEGRRQE